MEQSVIGKKLYDAIVGFDESSELQDEYYRIMDTLSGNKTADGHDETIREQILRVYGVLFCEDTGLAKGSPAGIDDVIMTADRLYIDSPGYDPDHWYRMKYHFPVIDEDNYDRFAALVISDLKAGPLHETAKNDGQMLIVGEADPLHMTSEQRNSQQTYKITLPGRDKI